MIKCVLHNKKKINFISENISLSSKNNKKYRFFCIFKILSHLKKEDFSKLQISKN